MPEARGAALPGEGGRDGPDRDRGARRGALPDPFDAWPSPGERCLRARPALSPTEYAGWTRCSPGALDRACAGGVHHPRGVAGGRKFYVDERVLIPAQLFCRDPGGQVDPWLRHPARVRGWRTSAPARAAWRSSSRAISEVHVDALDLSPEALEVAEINVRRHRLSGRVRLVESDLLSSAPSGRYDVILSNPPYEPRPMWTLSPRNSARAPPGARRGTGRPGPGPPADPRSPPVA